MLLSVCSLHRHKGLQVHAVWIQRLGLLEMVRNNVTTQKTVLRDTCLSTVTVHRDLHIYAVWDSNICTTWCDEKEVIFWSTWLYVQRYIMKYCYGTQKPGESIMEFKCLLWCDMKEMFWPTELYIQRYTVKCCWKNVNRKPPYIYSESKEIISNNTQVSICGTSLYDERAFSYWIVLFSRDSESYGNVPILATWNKFLPLQPSFGSKPLGWDLWCVYPWCLFAVGSECG